MKFLSDHSQSSICRSILSAIAEKYNGRMWFAKFRTRYCVNSLIENQITGLIL